MKRLFILTLLLALVGGASFAQKTVTCPMCGGLGGTYMAYSYIPCYYCMGEGTVPDPNEAMQKAYNYGANLMAMLMGKSALVRGDYEEAYNLFDKLFSEENSAEAALYLGAMVELGMGMESKKSLALKLYKYAADLGNSDAKAALQRIKSSGYWEATDAKRLWFRQALSVQTGVSMSPGNSGGGYYQGVSPGGNSSGSQSSGRRCAGCNGTGRCTMCNGRGGYWLDTGMYTGQDTKKWHTCSACNGSGQCQVCYGKGFIRY